MERVRKMKIDRDVKRYREVKEDRQMKVRNGFKKIYKCN